MCSDYVTTELATPWLMHDRRARYRKRRLTRADAPGPWPKVAPRAARTRSEPSEASAQPVVQHDQRAQAQQQGDQPTEHDRTPHDASARWRRITELNARLGATLDDEGRALWLALEEALHVHWLDVAVDHYHRGYAAGRAQGWADETLADASSLQDKLRAIALALAEVVETFTIPRRSG